MRRISFFLFLVLFCSIQKVYSQDSCRIRISLITLSPGDALETVFGHSAIRVRDDSSNYDLIYNYGTFDFNEPNFLSKFINGRLPYYLSNEDFLPFVQFHQSEKRTINEQVLNLTCSEKQNIIHFLYNNLQGTNKFYNYDFISDNCTTRLRDLLEKNLQGKIIYKRVVGPKTYFRKLLHADLDYHDHQWIKLGIDLLLGSRTDRIMTDREVMFLPDYLMATAGSSTINFKPLVVSKINLALDPSTEKQESAARRLIVHPLFILSIVTLIILFLSYNNKKRTNEMLERLDSLLFFLFGITGIVLIYLWCVSDQLNYRDNYNILWAWPMHLVFSFFSFRKLKWVKYYFRITAIVYSVLLLLWFFLPQHLNPSLIPVILLMIYRCLIRSNGGEQINPYVRKRNYL